MTDTLTKLLFPTETKALIGKIVQKQQDYSYVVRDSVNKQYLVESTEVYKVGQSVMIKNGIILNSVKSNIVFTHHVV